VFSEKQEFSFRSQDNTNREKQDEENPSISSERPMVLPVKSVTDRSEDLSVHAPKAPYFKENMGAEVRKN